MFRSPLVTLLPTVCLLASLVSAAQPEATIEKLLNTGWSKQYSVRAESDALYREFSETHGVDPRMTYAYALVLLQQGRYGKAEPQLRTATKFDPTAGAPRRALIRDLMLLKRHQAAIAEAETLSEQLSMLPVEGRPSEESFKSAALLGRMIGYLSGPSVQPTLKNELRRLAASADLWPLELKQEFEQAQTDVAQLHADYQSEIAQFQEKTEKEVQEQQEILAESVTERKQELAERQGDINEQAQKAQGDARDELAALVAQEQPLAASYAELERRAILIRRDLAPIVFDINQLLARADETESPVERNILLSRVDRVERIAARYEADLSALGREAARLEAQLAGLRQQQALVRARLASDQQRLAQQQKGLVRSANILEHDRRKLQKGLDVPTGGLRGLTRQAAAYTTYDAFDLAEQRQQIMASLAE